MKEIKATVYKFEELADDVKKKIIERERFNIMDNCMEIYSDDYHGTLMKLQDAVCCKARNWSVDYCDYNFRLEFGNHSMFDYMSADEICGKYLFRYVNSIIDNFAKGRWYSASWDAKNRVLHCGKGKLDRHSRIIMEYDNCPLTGMCYECGFEDVLLKYYRTWTSYPATYSLRDLMHDCFNAFFKEWYDEYQYWASDEGVIEQLSNSSQYEDEIFFEDGTECHDLSRFVA